MSEIDKGKRETSENERGRREASKGREWVETNCISISIYNYICIFIFCICICLRTQRDMREKRGKRRIIIARKRLSVIINSNYN